MGKVIIAFFASGISSTNVRRWVDSTTTGHNQLIDSASKLQIYQGLCILCIPFPLKYVDGPVSWPSTYKHYSSIVVVHASLKTTMS